MGACPVRPACLHELGLEVPVSCAKRYASDRNLAVEASRSTPRATYARFVALADESDGQVLRTGRIAVARNTACNRTRSDVLDGLHCLLTRAVRAYNIDTVGSSSVDNSATVAYPPAPPSRELVARSSWMVV